MSFGLHDKDWIDPDEEREQEPTCGDCGHYRECCETCRVGWCLELLEAANGDDPACEEFEQATR